MLPDGEEKYRMEKKQPVYTKLSKNITTSLLTKLIYNSRTKTEYGIDTDRTSQMTFGEVVKKATLFQAFAYIKQKFNKNSKIIS